MLNNGRVWQSAKDLSNTIFPYTHHPPTHTSTSLSMCEVTNALTMYLSSLRRQRLVAESQLFSELTADRIANEPTNLLPGWLGGRPSAGYKTFPRSLHLISSSTFSALSDCMAAKLYSPKLLLLRQWRAQIRFLCLSIKWVCCYLTAESYVSHLKGTLLWVVSFQCNAASGDALMVLSAWWHGQRAEGDAQHCSLSLEWFSNLPVHIMENYHRPRSEWFLS